MKALRVLVTTTALFAAGAAMADEAVVHDSLDSFLYKKC